MKLSDPADLKMFSFTTCSLTFLATDKSWELNHPRKKWTGNSASILSQITNLLQLVLTWISQRKQNDKWKHEKYWRHWRFLSFCLMRRGQNGRYFNNDATKFFSGQVQNTYFNSNKNTTGFSLTMLWTLITHKRCLQDFLVSLHPFTSQELSTNSHTSYLLQKGTGSPPSQRNHPKPQGSAPTEENYTLLESLDLLLFT